MAFIPLAVIIAGAAISALSAYKQGQAGQAQADYQAEVYKQQAQREQQIAQMSEEDFRSRESAVLAARRAKLGASGIDISTGTPLLGEADFAQEVELQARRIRAGGETTATRLEQQAGLYEQAGKASAQAGLFGAGSSLLAGLGTYYNYKPRYGY